MSVKILKRQYRNNYAPPTETDNPDWLIGNSGDWLTATFDVEAGIDYIATSDQPLMINYEENTIKLMNGKKWGDYGFDINRTVKFVYTRVIVDPETGDETPTTVDTDLVIINIFNDTLEFEENADIENIQFETIPTDRGSVRIEGVKMYDDREIEGLRMKYSNISNDEVQSHTLNSFIDGTETEATFVGLNNIGDASFHDMTLIGMQSGMSIKHARIQKSNTTVTDDSATFSAATSDPVIISIPGTRKNMGTARAMTRITGDTPPYQDQLPLSYAIQVGDTVNYGAGVSGQMFIDNSDFSGLRNISILMHTTIINNYSGGTNRKLNIVLMRYTGGTARTFAEKTILATYPVTNEIRWILQIYNQVLSIDIVAGESYSLGYEYAVDNTTPFPSSRSVEFIPNLVSVQVVNIANPTGYKKKYTIELKYMLSSFWEELDNMETDTPPSNLFNASSLTDNVLFEFYPEWNNPNVITRNDMAQTERQGSTGWFNENYNGLPNNFEVIGVEYFDMGGTNIPSLSYGSDAKIKARIRGVANLSANSRFQYGFVWIPNDEEQYQEKATPFHKNVKVNSSDTQVFNLGLINGATIEGFSEDNAKMNVRGISFYVDEGDVVFEAIFSPTEEFKDFFLNRTDDRKYGIWVSVADHTLVTNFSDRVNLIVDVNNMDFYIPVSGQLEGVSTAFIEHPEAADVAGVEIYDGFLEDDVLVRSFFQLPKNVRATQIVMGYEAQNLTTEATYELDRFGVSLGQFVTDNNGTQQINFNAERGYKLQPGNNKNWVKIIRDPNSDTEEMSGYQILFAAKIRWEDWLQRQNVPPEYFNADLEHNGSNNNWLNYQDADNNHKINYFVMFDLVEDGVTNRYKNQFYLTFKGYDTNTAVITTEHNYYDDETNTLINVGNDPETGRPLGVLLSNKNTRIEIIYTLVAGTWDIGNVYCVTTLEAFRGAGVLEHRQLSSIWGSEYDNILIPLNGFNKLKVEQIASDKIKASCLVDYTRLQPTAKYKITGRIGCFANENGIPIPTRIYDEAHYENKYE